MNNKAINKAFYARMATDNLYAAIATYEESIAILKQRMDEDDGRYTPQEYRAVIAQRRADLDTAQAELDSRHGSTR